MAVLLCCRERSGWPADAGAAAAKAEPCEVCHGKDGVSTDPAVPSLAGQHKLYTVRELQAYKKGSRKNAAMNTIARSMTDKEMSGLANYFAGLRPMTAPGNSLPAAPGGEQGPSLFAQGEVSYSFCQNCHGPRGYGNQANPRIAGQQAPYLIEQLKAYKSGARKSPIMSGIASALDENEIKALAAYMAALK